jgi:hypothetical protein
MTKLRFHRLRLRDALLPKLLSGEIRVAEAANEVRNVKGEG